MYANIGDSFEHTETLDQDKIADFAKSIGDFNPLHHDMAAAGLSRFGGIIACGPHHLSILLALAANHFTRNTSMLGLEFSFKFKGPAMAGDALRFRWEVTDVLWNEKLKGDIVSLTGSVFNSGGAEILSAQGKVLVTERL